jgi:carboxyl-terminal processing protease
MQNKKIKYYVWPIVVIICLAGVFYLGWFFGQKQINYSGETLIVSNNNAVISASTTKAVDMGPFWDAWKILDNKFVDTHHKTASTTEQDKVWGAIQGLAASYGDPYTVFMPPVEAKTFDEDISGDFEGLGMEIAVKDGWITVVSPLKGTPAAAAGLLSGDKIISINGTSTANMTTEEAVKLIRGPKGTTVKLMIAREGKTSTFEKIVTRDVINIPTVDTELKDGVFVIHLYNFYAKSPELFRDALKKFIDSGTNKLVIDLRGNPGGYLDGAVSIASWFLPLGKVVVREDGGANNGEKIHRSLGYNIFTDQLRLVILADGGSASASEILAGALRDHGLAKIVGTKTFGKGSVQEVIKLTSNTSLKVTIARWLTPNGYSISESGLIPDFEVKMTDDDRAKARDPQLIKALEVVKAM